MPLLFSSKRINSDILRQSLLSEHLNMTSLPRISSFYRQNSGGSKLTWYTWYTMPSHSTTGAWTSSSVPSLWMHHPNIPARTFNTCQETVLPVQCGSPPAFRERCRKLSAWKLVPFWPSREAKAGSLARRAQAPPARSVSVSVAQMAWGLLKWISATAHTVLVLWTSRGAHQWDFLEIKWNQKLHSKC